MITKFNAWCTKYTGILLLLAILATLIAPYLPPANSLPTLLSKISCLLTFAIPLKVYQLVLLAIVAAFYIKRLRKKYKIQSISQKLLIGSWQNNWGPPNGGTQIASITKEMDYFVGGRPHFKVKNFTYDFQKNILEFDKVSTRPGDNRTLHNILRIENNDTLNGTEKDYPIKYTRVSN